MSFKSQAGLETAALTIMSGVCWVVWSEEGREGKGDAVSVMQPQGRARNLRSSQTLSQSHRFLLRTNIFFAIWHIKQKGVP